MLALPALRTGHAPFDAYEVFEGNRHDSKTLKTIVDVMERKYGRSQRIWVLDRGIASEKNLEMLRARDGRYIVGTPKAALRKFEQHLLDQDWIEVQIGSRCKPASKSNA